MPVAAQAPLEPSQAIEQTTIFGSYVIAPSVPLILHNPPRWTYFSCVQYVKALLGRLDESWGDARYQKPTHQDPHYGDVILTSEGGGHEGLVIEVSSASVTFMEANYRAGQKDTRSLPLDSPLIRGYW